MDSVYYDPNGKELGSDRAWQTIEPIIPGSTGEKMLDFVCK
jgi:hypothetical protein